MNNNSSDKVGAFFSAYIWLKDNENTKTFIERMKIPEKRQLYVSRYTPSLILLTNPDELIEFEKDDSFLEWSYYNFEEPQKNEVILSQIGAERSEFNGEGVKLGVISAENLTFNPQAKSLEGIEITALPSALPPRVDRHPSVVLSQIVGNTLNADGVEFKGIAQGVEVYFASAKTTKNVYEAIENMLDLGVRIINYSAGNPKGGYSDFDRQIDRLISHGNFVFVTVSGNIASATSPGRAYNCISVGNLVTKKYPDTPLAPPWDVWCYSEDNCSGFTTSDVHKPDLVAPGAWVGFVNEKGVADFDNFGTSFACPWVSGISALIIQALDKEYSYLTIKAIILLSCNQRNVSSTDNPEIASHIRLRSGYGLVDEKRAVALAQSVKIIEGVAGDFRQNVLGNENLMLVFEGKPSVKITLDGIEYPLGNENTLYIEKRSKEGVIPLSVSGDKARFSLVMST